ncbi:iron ABC transporter permease [Lactiplantibacillus garii]|uniref:Iron ABC transporter permease n=1 Tax=Lactiplantibacillus garii TaxID=2306423 RepID=A0A3R8KJ79_9LACO|nr:iron ABC transporter permease [Lactiplantibacillus garii]RRK10883.1 iron ABC transporter permease [Lactiplantibacillus garii]
MTNHRTRNWLSGVLTLGLALLIIGPLVALVSQTLFGSRPGELWRQLTAPVTLTSLRHSLLLGAGTIIGTTLIASPIAWIMTRTKLARATWLHWLLLVPFMTPPYINAMGWIYFFQPHGLLNQLGAPAGNFHWLFSPFGMMLIMSLHLYPVAYLLLKTALNQFNQRWLDAATVHGVSAWRQLTRVTLPILLLPYLAVWVLVFTKTLAEFGTPATFGRNIHFEVLTTTIQKDLSQWPLDFKNGVLTGSLLLVIALLAWLIQQLFLNRPAVKLTTNQAPKLDQRPVTTVLAAAFTSLLILAAMGVPYVSIITQSLFKQRSAGIAAGNWTLVHYLDLLRFDSPAFQALITTFGLALAIGILNLALGLLISLGSVTATLPRWIRQTLKVLGALPLAIPNVVLALSLMILFSQWFAFTKLYGTVAILMIADITLFLPTTVQYLTTALHEFDTTLLASARVFEPSQRRILFKIVLPVLLPAMLNSFAMAFIATSRELVVALLLLPSGMTTISSFIFQSFEQGDASQGMALAVITVLITFMIMLGTNRLMNPTTKNK